MSSDAPHAQAPSHEESPVQPLSHEEAPARALSQKEPQALALSQWLQLMLAEIHAKREAQECGRVEDERRRAEASGTPRS